MKEIVVVAEKAFVFNGKLIEINNKEITVCTEYMGESLDIYTRDVLRDIFFQYYQGQNIVIHSGDGEPLRDLGIVDFVSTLCAEFNIPKSSVKFKTHDDATYPGFNKELKKLEIFWAAKEHTNLDVSLKPDAKFLGIAVGRITPPRARTMFRLDKEFPNNTFIICQNKPPFDDRPLSRVKHLYTEESDWFQKYQFEKDLSQSFVAWQSSCQNYHNIWGNYKLEVVCETHANSEYWFTEKTARCLITGKPFVLLSGPGTLAKLRSMGFQTFGTIIDESYDQEKSWPHRLDKMLTSLKQLHSRSDLDDALRQLYDIGKFNQRHYLKNV